MSKTTTNAHEYSVSELAFALKRTVEDSFGRVRVRGELGRVTIAKSGHMYADVKDDKAVIASIMWAGQVRKLSVRPEEGMEVICEGKLSTYPGRSQYQLIIDKLEPAGEGALMALLEKRKKQFAEEGLFDEERKQDLPYLPQTIGVVTSPTGAVIRDILHRLADRFPVHVLVWPVLVQGEASAGQVAAAINGFNAMDNPPDVLIVARGGGSIEDLWGFNEEIVVRAAAASEIPLISAVGHETDWTLLDYVADARAPTPTGAAEIAVPVRDDLITTVDDYGVRLRRGLAQTIRHKRLGLNAAKLPSLSSVLAVPQQRFDLLAARLTPALNALGQKNENRLGVVTARLRPDILRRDLNRRGEQIAALSAQGRSAIVNQLERSQARLDSAGKLLDAYSYQGVLARGFVVVTDSKGRVVREGKPLKPGAPVTLGFVDGKRAAVIDGAAPNKARPRAKRSTTKNQPELF